MPRFHDAPPTLDRYAMNASMSANPGLWDGLVGAWVPALGVQGMTLVDVSGNGLVGTITGTYGWAISDLGSTLSLVNDAAHVNVNCPSLPNWSIRAKVKITTLDSYNMIWAGGSSTKYSCFAVQSNGALNFNYLNQSNNNNAATAPLAPGRAANQWYDFVQTYGSNIRTYVNGIETTPVSYVGTYQPTAISMIGGWTGASNDGLKGQIAEVELYSRILTSSDIALLAAIPLAPFRLKRRVIVRGASLTNMPWLYTSRNRRTIGAFQ